MKMHQHLNIQHPIKRLTIVVTNLCDLIVSLNNLDQNMQSQYPSTVNHTTTQSQFNYANRQLSVIGKIPAIPKIEGNNDRKFEEMNYRLYRQEQRVEELERIFKKYRKSLKNITDHLEKQSVYKEKQRKIIPIYKMGVSDKSMKARRSNKSINKEDVIKDFNSATKRGVTMTKFCEMNNFSQRTLRRMIHNK